jgi:2-polyprenyl-6-methoxyphenol hydroxylase-like FAD-dependent oxidoreductase
MVLARKGTDHAASDCVGRARTRPQVRSCGAYRGRRADQSVTGSRTGGLLTRSLEILDQRGIADRFVSQGEKRRVMMFPGAALDTSDMPSRRNYWLALRQEHIERLLWEWAEELSVPIYRGEEVTGFAQDGFGAEAALSGGKLLRADGLVGCDGGRSLVRKTANIGFPGWGSLAQLPHRRRRNGRRARMGHPPQRKRHQRFGEAG